MVIKRRELEKILNEKYKSHKIFNEENGFNISFRCLIGSRELPDDRRFIAIEIHIKYKDDCIIEYINLNITKNNYIKIYGDPLYQFGERVYRPFDVENCHIHSIENICRKINRELNINKTKIYNTLVLKIN